MFCSWVALLFGGKQGKSFVSGLVLKTEYTKRKRITNRKQFTPYHRGNIRLILKRLYCFKTLCLWWRRKYICRRSQNLWGWGGGLNIWLSEFSVCYLVSLVFSTQINNLKSDYKYPIFVCSSMCIFKNVLGYIKRF